MIAVASENALHALEFVDETDAGAQIIRIGRKAGCESAARTNCIIDETAAQLDRYFQATLRSFTVPLAPAGTAFQQRAWQQLLKVPYGATRSYGEQAVAIGQPTATRAVARANGDNPIAIIIPCHRIIGANGSLTGYGGGMWRKKWLLELESGGVLPL